MTHDHRTPDSLEDLLRRSFQARAEQVVLAPDALNRIRARTGRRRAVTAGLASLATVATAAVVALLVGVLRHPAPVVLPPPASQPPSMAVTGPADRLPIYYTASVHGASMLYREFHPVTGSLDPLSVRIEAAVRIMLAGRPFDPDYHSDWPATVTVRTVDVDARGVATVDLTGAMATGAAGAMALQQLTYTVTAVAADRGVQLSGVRVRHDGADWSDGPLTRAPALETLAPVWLISPQQGDIVGRSVDVHVAAVLGMTVRLRILDVGGAVIDNKTVAVAAIPGSGATASRGEGHLTIALPPGRYTLETRSMSGGEPPVTDDHDIIVT